MGRVWNDEELTIAMPFSLFSFQSKAWVRPARVFLFRGNTFSLPFHLNRQDSTCAILTWTIGPSLPNPSASHI